MTRGGSPIFDPGDNRAISREAYTEGRRMARLTGHLRETWQDHQRRWDDLAHRLTWSYEATPEDVARLQEDAHKAGRCTTVDALTYFEASAARYMGGQRFCAVCGHLAPLRDDECPDCCH